MRAQSVLERECIRPRMGVPACAQRVYLHACLCGVRLRVRVRVHACVCACEGCVRACVCVCGCVYAGVAVRACAPADGEQLLSTANIVLVAGTSPSAEFHDLGFGEAAHCSCGCGSGSEAVQ